MTLRLYLDDCANAGIRRGMLQAAGHTVVIPAEVGLTGQEDHVHLLHASEHHLVLVTR